MQTQQFSVRAMPPTGYERRFRAGRAWGKEATIVTVVDKPAPARFDTDRDGKRFVTHSNEVSPEQLQALMADSHFAVSPVGSPDASATELNAAKARVLELHKEIEQLKLEFQGAIEEHKAFRAGAMKDAEEQAGKIVQLQSQLKDAQSMLTPKGKK